MNWSITIRPEADQDLLDACEWYERHRDGLGDEFLVAATDALDSLEQSPQTSSLYYGDFRRFLIDRFPYKIFYQIDGSEVIIFRILHAARDHRKELE